MASEVPLVVLAAGMGRRFGGPKPFFPVGPSGEAIVDYTAHDAHKAGFSPIVLVVNSAARSAVERHVAGYDVGPVVLAEQDTAGGVPPREKPWGTVHAVVACRDVLGGVSGSERPFGVVNGDDLYGLETLRELADALRSEPQHNHIVAYRWRHTMPPSGTANRGVCEVDEAGRLSSIREVTGLQRDSDIAGDTVVSMNVWGFTPEALHGFERLLGDFVAMHRHDDAELALPDAVGTLVARGEIEVDVHTTEATWFGITYQSDVTWVREHVAATVREGRYATPLWRLQ